MRQGVGRDGCMILRSIFRLPEAAGRVRPEHWQGTDRTLAGYGQNMVRASSEYHLHQQHVAYRPQRDAGKGIALPEVESHHHGNGYEPRQAIGVGQRCDSLQAVDHQHGHDGGREDGPQVADQPGDFLFTAEEEEGKPSGNLGAQSANKYGN